MDINVLRIAVMVTGLVLFLALWAWAWSRRRQADFGAAAALPFLDDEPGAPAAQGLQQQGGAR